MDAAAKKGALRLIPYGLYVMGVRTSDAHGPAASLNAFIASWVSQCSFEPPLVMVGVKRGTRSHTMLEDSGVFTLNLLRKGNEDLAKHFLKHHDPDDETFGGVRYATSTLGAPIFPDLPSYVECKVLAVHDHGGDHSIVVGEVVGAAHDDDAGGALGHSDMGWHYGG